MLCNIYSICKTCSQCNVSFCIIAIRLRTLLYKKGISFWNGKSFPIFLLFNFMIAFTEMQCYMLYCMLFILFPPPISLPPSCCLSVMKSSTLDVSSCLLSLTGPWQNVHHDAIFRSKNWGCRSSSGTMFWGATLNSNLSARNKQTTLWNLMPFSLLRLFHWGRGKMKSSRANWLTAARV